LVGWLGGWLLVGFADWLAGVSVGWLVGWLVVWFGFTNLTFGDLR